ncbi:MAG: hypothetical protein EXS18_06120 [Verrucomicrobiae bacterium]|nr:hypothetical protein [Verrucomicrobiae bacterium]
METAPKAIASIAEHNRNARRETEPAFVTAATRLIASLHEVRLAVKADADHDKYLKALGGVTPNLDLLLRTADETGLYKSNPEVRDFCTKASSIFLSYNQALEQWNHERLLRANKNVVKLAHEVVIQTVTDKTAVNKSIQETTGKLNDLTAEVMKAMESRYDLWVNAAKQTDAAAAILVGMRDL